MSLLPRITPRSPQQRQLDDQRALIRKEAEIGGKLFGPLPKGHHRQFFCLDERTWVWHEEWSDVRGKHHVVTTRYDVRPDGILKMQDGQSYQRVSYEEAKNLYAAAKLYNKKVHSYYRTLQHAA